MSYFHINPLYRSFLVSPVQCLDNPFLIPIKVKLGDIKFLIYFIVSDIESNLLITLKLISSCNTGIPKASLIALFLEEVVSSLYLEKFLYCIYDSLILISYHSQIEVVHANAT